MAVAGTPLENNRRDWRGAFQAMRALLADANDTRQVFKVMAALNAGTAQRNYHRLLQTVEGGRIAYARIELVPLLTDSAWLARFAPGTVGATYRAFLDKTGYSADGLAAVGNLKNEPRNIEHPYAWFGRRERDMHDIWHVLTGYEADDPLGELCLVAFSYAQTRGLGWGFIALTGVLNNLRRGNFRATARAVWEGYRHGRSATWLSSQDIPTLFAEPLEAARTRLGILAPVAYATAKAAALESTVGTAALSGSV